MLRVSLVTLFTLVLSSNVFAQSQPAPSGSIAAEADVLAYGINGYSGIVNVTFANKMQMAFGIGAYDVPSFLLEGDDDYDAVQWTARATSVQVFRATYRFRGAMHSGPAVGAVILNQNWRLRAEQLAGETTFRPLSVGITAGYYAHIGKHFYIYPTAAFTYNNVVSGSNTLGGKTYDVEAWSPNASVHVGWEWEWKR